MAKILDKILAHHMAESNTTVRYESLEDWTAAVTERDLLTDSSENQHSILAYQLNPENTKAYYGFWSNAGQYGFVDNKPYSTIEFLFSMIKEATNPTVARINRAMAKAGWGGAITRYRGGFYYLYTLGDEASWIDQIYSTVLGGVPTIGPEDEALTIRALNRMAEEAREAGYEGAPSPLPLPQTEAAMLKAGDRVEFSAADFRQGKTGEVVGRGAADYWRIRMDDDATEYALPEEVRLLDQKKESADAFHSQKTWTQACAAKGLVVDLQSGSAATVDRYWTAKDAKTGQVKGEFDEEEHSGNIQELNESTIDRYFPPEEFEVTRSGARVLVVPRSEEGFDHAVQVYQSLGDQVSDIQSVVTPEGQSALEFRVVDEEPEAPQPGANMIQVVVSVGGQTVAVAMQLGESTERDDYHMDQASWLTAAKKAYPAGRQQEEPTGDINWITNSGLVGSWSDRLQFGWVQPGPVGERRKSTRDQRLWRLIRDEAAVRERPPRVPPPAFLVYPPKVGHNQSNEWMALRRDKSALNVGLQGLGKDKEAAIADLKSKEAASGRTN